MFQQTLPTRPATPSMAPLPDRLAEAAPRRSAVAGTLQHAGGPWRLGLVQLLNDARVNQLVGALRYQRHQATAQGQSALSLAHAFRAYAEQSAAHAERLASRIVQLGGQPDVAPDAMARRSHLDGDGSTHPQAMVRANLAAEQAVVEATRQLIALVREQDPTTRRLLEDILADATQHAHALQGGLAD